MKQTLHHFLPVVTTSGGAFNTWNADVSTQRATATPARNGLLSATPATLEDAAYHPPLFLSFGSFFFLQPFAPSAKFPSRWSQSYVQAQLALRCFRDTRAHEHSERGSKPLARALEAPLHLCGMLSSAKRYWDRERQPELQQIYNVIPANFVQVATRASPYDICRESSKLKLVFSLCNQR